MSKPEDIQAIKFALSEARMSTYEGATAGSDQHIADPLTLNSWNAQVSASLLAPLHICEVVMRNAVSEALDIVYGSSWPWSMVFEQSLPAPKLGYSARRDLQNARSHARSTGKVIPELKFVFWQDMFTSRQDIRLWNDHLRRVLPNLDASMLISSLREQIYRELEEVRRLRNRIAHHEPIFARDLAADLQRMVSLVALRSRATAEWMMNNQQASALISARPKL